MSAALELLSSKGDLAGLAYATVQLGKLNAASLELSQIRDEQELYRAVPRLLAQTLDFSVAVFNLDIAGSLTVKGMYLASDEDGTRSADIWRQLRAGLLPKPKELRQCVRDNQTLRVTSDHEWPSCFDFAKTILLTPVRSGEQPVGLLLACLERGGRDLDEHDLQRFETFANMVGLALENVRTLRNLELRVEERTRHLRDAQAQLVQSEKMTSLGMLVAGMAHELNTPTGAISGSCETLARAFERVEARARADDRALSRTLDVIRDGIAVIASGSSRIRDMVGRLRSFSCLDQAELQRVDLHTCIEDTLTLVGHALDGIAVVRDFDELPPLLCRPGRLNQLFMNLLLNAREAIDGVGRITVRTRSSDDAVTVSISDDGRGISAEHLCRIFDPGFTTKGVGVGSGLGLAICLNIAREHHGRLEVESSPAGTTFTLMVPLASAAVSAIGVRR